MQDFARHRADRGEPIVDVERSPLVLFGVIREQFPERGVALQRADISDRPARDETRIDIADSAAQQLRQLVMPRTQRA